MPKSQTTTLKEGKWEYETIYYYYDSDKNLTGPNFFKTDLIITQKNFNFYDVFLPAKPEYKVVLNLQNLKSDNIFLTGINCVDDRKYRAYPVKINKSKQIIKARGFDISAKAWIPNGSDVACSSKIVMTWKSKN